MRHQQTQPSSELLSYNVKVLTESPTCEAAMHDHIMSLQSVTQDPESPP